MEQQKLTNQKEAITFLCHKYPKCFFLEGPVQPLKIGIFQELAADLDNVDIISKRLLRISLRHYTNSWRYLLSVKTGVNRIDLAGEPGDKVEEQHALHAQQQLKDSKEKAAKFRAENAKDKNNSKHAGYSKSAKKVEHADIEGAKQDSVKAPKAAKNAQQNKGKAVVKRSNKSASPSDPVYSPISDAELAIGKHALVKLGKEPMPVTITDIGKDGVLVQLNSGMTVRVQQAQLFSTSKVTGK